MVLDLRGIIFASMKTLIIQMDLYREAGFHVITLGLTKAITFFSDVLLITEGL